MTHHPGTKLCACGCGTSLQHHRVDAKWATGACEKRWKRENPGKSAREAHAIVVGPTKPRRRSGVSIRISARAAVRVLADQIYYDGCEYDDALARARELILPLVNPRHRELL